MNHNKEKSFEQLFYECHEYCIKQLINMTGNKTDAEEVFMEAISKFWMRLQQGKVKHQDNVKAFVLVTAKRIWIEQQRKNKMTVLSDNNSEHLYIQSGGSDFEEFDKLIKEELEREASAKYQQKMMVFNLAFVQLGDTCQKLLKGRFVYKVKGKDLAEQLGLKNADVVKTTITRCKQTLRKYYIGELQKLQKI